jgi:hypothetical protein
MQIQSQSFLLPAAVTVLSPLPLLTQVQYYTDCVFNPEVFSTSMINLGVTYQVKACEPKADHEANKEGAK